MIDTSKAHSTKIRVCLVSPFPPPFGGMAIQATQLIPCLEGAGLKVLSVRTNANLPSSLVWVKKIPFLRTIITSLVFWINLRRAVLQSDIVYFLTGFFNFFFWVTYPALILIKISRKKVILSAHGGAAADFFHKYGFWLKPIIHRVDAITAPSGFLQQAFVDAFGIKPIIIPNILDLEQFSFRERFSLHPRLIVTRSLEDIYNVGCVIKAFTIVQNNYPGATLAIIGDGSQRQMLENLVKESGIEKKVVFHGRVAHEQIYSLYDENDIFINASNVDNMPGTILEAYACGLPIVTTKAGGIPYIVKNRSTGLLVDCNDCEGLAKGVIELLENQDLVKSMTLNGLRECDRYSMDRVRKTLLPVLEQQINKV